MNIETLLARAREAALAAGARQVDCFHRSSHSRILTLDAGHGEWAERREEGMAVRAWARDGEPGMAAVTAGGDPVAMGRRAAELSGARPLAARAGAQRPGEAQEEAGAEEMGNPGGDAPAGAGPAGDAAAPGSEADARENQVGVAMMAPAALDLFDPEFLRASRGDLEHRLAGLAAATGITRRSGLPATTQAVLRLATLDRHLLTTAGVWQSQRSTLASLRLRFASAFGLSTVEIASRRLESLETAPLVPWLAAHPGPAGRMARFRVVPHEQGDTVLTLAPPVMAALLTSVAARVAATGRPMVWNAPAVLRDDPFIPWGPGTTPLDGEGQATRRVILAAGDAALPAAQDRLPPGTPATPSQSPAAESAGSPQTAGRGEPAPVTLNSLRLSYREPPRPLPTNLILEGLPAGGAAAAGARFHLLDVVARHGAWLLVRAVDRGREGPDQPVLMEIPARLESFFHAGATAGPAQPFLVGDAFVSSPAVTVPGWRAMEAG
jgi:hypothetical protein